MSKAAPSYDTTLTLTPSVPQTPVNPRTHLPETFRIGDRPVAPFVTVPELVQHLTLLACLHRLQQDVRECPTKSGPELSGDVKWAAFCVRAAHRFEEWIASPQVQRKPNTHESLQALFGSVDIDIFMVWHTYLLNPAAYNEDMIREGQARGRLLAFRSLGVFPLAHICARIDPETFVFQHEDAPPAYATHPLRLIDISRNETVRIKCPNCRRGVDAPLLGPESTPQGYATNEFCITCKCGTKITHEALRVFNYYTDIKRHADGEITHLAGLRGHGIDASALSACVRRAAQRVPTDSDYTVSNHDVVVWCKRACWQLEGVRVDLDWARQHLIYRYLFDAKLHSNGVLFRKMIRTRLPPALRSMGRVYSSRSGTVSFDLGAAVMRQAAFISSMERIGWLDIERWSKSTDETRFYLLQKAAARYHAFLDLMQANPKSFLSPTLDIDLAWHTHQLRGSRYAQDTTAYIGRLVDHDDKIPDVTLKKAYDETASLWASRFGVPYSGCGCPIPHTAKRKLELYHREKNRRPTGLKFWKVHYNRRQSVALGQAQIAQMLSDMPAEERGASCPSTHNLVHVSGRKTKGTPNETHADPFGARYVFVPRRVRGTRANFGPPQRNRDAADAYMYGYPMYWGVAPYTYGPYPMADPWCSDANGRGGGCGGGGCGGFGGSGGGCATGGSCASGGGGSGGGCGGSGGGDGGGGGGGGCGGGGGGGGGCGGGGC